MKLVSCHIDNFGKISGEDRDFSAGLNCICTDNGTGKSTLASFIKVMLYGFSGEKVRKNEYENERKFFRPWQGGTYGGNLTFEKDGVNYCIYRTFGTKESEDVLKIMNTETGMADHSFEPVPGIALFGIDADSFERTAYVSQQDCATSVTGDISARIGGVSEKDDDMRRYAAADEILKKESDRLNPSRATGLINKEENELSKLKDLFRNIDSQKGLCVELSSKAEQAAVKSEEDRKSQIKLKNRLDALRKYFDLKEQKDNYDNLKEAREKAENELRSAKSIFEGTIPTQEEAEKWVETSIALRDDEKELRSHDLTPAEAERLEEETRKFAKKIPASSEIDKLLKQWNMIQELKDELPDRRDQAEMIKNQALEEQREKYKPFIALATGGAVIILAAVLAAVITKIYPIVAASVIGIALIVYGLVLRKRHNDETRAKGEGTSKRYNELMEQIAEDEELVEGTEMDAQDLLGAVGVTYVGRSAMSDLINLRNQVREYEALGNKKKQYEELVKEKDYEGRLSAVKEYVKKCSIMGTRSSIPESDASEICLPVSEIATRVEQITVRQSEVDDAVTRVKVFETDHNVLAYNGLVRPEDDTVTVFDLETALKKCEESIANDDKLVESCKKELQEAEEICATMESAHEEYERRSEELEVLKKRYDIVTKTREYLSIARDNFNTRYIKDIQASFDKYFKMLSGDDGKVFTIDANLNVTYVEKGQPRVPDTLSEGYKDLVGLCRRVAMADAMYASEKPFIVLDDPFVNLDDKKLSGATRFISDVASGYQIIYFTCQSARKFS
jgi:energy-coupling factor transporter ATP-binding protein EcfA2